MKLDSLSFANAAALIMAVVYVVCRLSVGLFPDLTLAIAQSWFHGIDLARISGWNLGVGSFVLGLISLSLFTWVVDYVFAEVYNNLVKK